MNTVKTVEDVLLIAHKVVHGDATEIVINGEKFTASFYTYSQCKHIKIADIDYVEQNKRKESRWGLLARLGHKITWGIRKETSIKPWLLCVDGMVVEPKDRNDLANKLISHAKEVVR